MISNQEFCLISCKTGDFVMMDKSSSNCLGLPFLKH